MLEAEQRLLTQLWVGPQQVVLPQHFCPALQAPGEPALPQHDWPALMQYFVPFVPVQQVWPAVQETLPQQKPPELEQNVVPPEFVQQVCPALQEEFPQHNWPALIQYFEPFVPVQHVWPALQAILPQQNPPEPVQNVVEPEVQQVWPALQEEPPQHSLPAAIQNGFVALPAAGQQLFPGEHAGEHVAAFARLIPIALKTMPISKAPSNLTACRRGIGLARIRAASSTRWVILLEAASRFSTIIRLNLAGY
jgi:hypothetical protein